VPQRVLDGAVTAWRRQIAAKTGLPFARTRPARVIWYVGQTVASWQAVAVIFEVDSDAGERLVTGWAATGQVLEGQPAWTGGSSPWVLFDVAAPWPTRGLAIGLNLHGTAIRPGPNPDSWVIVLAAPDVWTMRLSVRHSPAPATGKGAGFVLWPPRQGLLVRDVGQLGSRVKLILFLDNGRGQVPPHPAYVGVPGSRASQIPYLAAPVAIPARPGFRPVAGLTDQGSSRTSLVRPRGRLAILARCYGAGRLRVSYGSGAARVTLGTLKCDDYVHELTTNVRLSTPHTGFWFDASDLTAYRVMLGTVR